MKKLSIAAIVASVVACAPAVAADSHQNYVGSVAGLKDSVTIRSADQVKDLIKYTDAKTAAKLLAAYNEDGKLTAAEIKASGISDHHFYTGYLAAATTQSQYDARMKELNGGSNMDDKFVSNRDLKAHGSMVMNQVEAGNKLQDARTDKIVAGLKDLGNFLQAGNLPSDELVEQEKPVTPPPAPTPTPEYDDTQVKTDIATNAGNIETNKQNIAAVGDAVKTNTNNISTNTSNINKNTAAIQNNSDRISVLEDWKGQVDNRLTKMDKKMSSGIAGVAAMANVPSPAVMGTTTIGAGVGHFNSQTSIAVGASTYFNNGISLKGSVAAGNEFVVGAGVGFTFN